MEHFKRLVTEDYGLEVIQKDYVNVITAAIDSYIRQIIKSSKSHRLIQIILSIIYASKINECDFQYLCYLLNTLIKTKDECLEFFDSCSDIYNEILALSEKFTNVDDLSKALKINIVIIKEEEENEITISLINPQILMFDEIVFIYVKAESFYSAVPRQKSLQEKFSSYLNELFYNVIYSLANTSAASSLFSQNERKLFDTCEKMRTPNNGSAKNAKNIVIKSQNNRIYQKVIPDIDYSKII